MAVGLVFLRVESAASLHKSIVEDSFKKADDVWDDECVESRELGDEGAVCATAFRCGCCFGEGLPIAESVPCDDGHLFCRQCLENYIDNLSGSGKTAILCLGPDCEASFSTHNLSFIDQKLLQSLEKEHLLATLADIFCEVKDGKLHQCPSCDSICLVPASVLQFVCFQCRGESCHFCGVDWKKHMEYR